MLDSQIPTLDEQEEDRRIREALARAAYGTSPSTDEEKKDDSLGKAVGRGVANAAAETVDTVTGIGQFVAEKTGIFDALGYTEEERTMQNPLSQAIRNMRREYLDANESNTFYGLVEGVSQFGAGMVALSGLRTGRLATRGVQALAKTGRAGEVTASALGNNALRGAVADFAAFDPYEKRLSNIVQDQLPEYLRPALFTAAESDDSEVVARAKQVLEGFLIGSSVDMLVAGVRASRARKAGDIGAFNKALDEAEAASTREDGYRVVQAGDEFVAVGPDGSTIASAPTRSGAESAAVSASMEGRLNRVGMDEELIGRIRATASELAQKPEADVAELAATIGDVNPNYVGDTPEARQFTTALAQELRETMHGLRRAGKMDWGSLEGQAASFLKTEGLDLDKSPADWLAAVTDEVFGKASGYVRSVEDAAAAMTAYRISRAKATEQVAYWSKRVSLEPADAKALENLTRSIQAAADFHAYQTTLGARFGAGLNARKMPVGAGGVLRDIDPTGEGPQKGSAKVRFRVVNSAEEAERLREAARQARQAERNAELDAQELAGKNVKESLDRNRRDMKSGRAVEDLDAQPPKVTELDNPEVVMSAGEMRALARQIAVLTEPHELDYVYDALTTYFKRHGPDGPAPKAPKTVKELWDQTPSNSSFSPLDGNVGGKVMNFAIGYRMNAMLSGPKTQGTNILSGLMNSLYLPFERGLARAFQGDFSGFDPRSPSLLAGLWHSASDSMRLAKAAFKEGKDSLDAYHGASHATLPEWAQASWQLRLLQLPSRLMLSGDEFFKQMSYRSMIRAQSIETAMKEGITDTATILARVEDDLKAAFNNGMVEPDMMGAAVNPRALQYAREVTWTTPLDGAIGKRLLQMTQEIPELRLFLPFVRIPTNIMKWQFERFPALGLLMKRNLDALRSGDAAARSEVMARQTMGVAFFGTATMLAAGGFITGRGPTDPNLRKEWMASGFRPYSIRVGERWVDYRRLEPFATPLGFAADARDIFAELEQDDRENMLLAGTAAFINFTFNKTYMKGLSDLFDALGNQQGSGGDALSRVMGNLAGSFVPNVLNQTNPDPVLRETQTFMDQVMSRIPGFSATLEPRRNFFGEQVRKPSSWVDRSFNPLVSAGMFRGEDKWLEEIVRLGAPVGMPNETMYGLDLRDRGLWTRKDGKSQSPYDRWMELTAQPTPSMPSLKESLKALVESPVWKNVPAGTAEEPGGIRLQMVRERVSQYRQIARDLMLNEYEGPGGVPMRRVFIDAEMKARAPGEAQAPLTGRYFR